MLPIDNLLKVLRERHLAGQGSATSTELARLAEASPATAKRWLALLVQAEKVARAGQGRATRYACVDVPEQNMLSDTPVPTSTGDTPTWSAASQSLRKFLVSPLAGCNPVTYQHHRHGLRADADSVAAGRDVGRHHRQIPAHQESAGGSIFPLD
ncbi:hypothetical protein QN362_18775 [Actimicrobium sp. CCC2.4]|uniref:hypothetical protein n=1 Tax=Actimicrobium sp. CCC2.4 TaxID=3048606 RepID=UPI002AC90DF0|nr:hypothetical protein [Actimicrobium sp. CCC2.4]MEB0137378.1 hypothetical protein [Actimicrobium sp. CCC2.4]WPX32554.1 hypothetical protein RHM62_01525 [Actimicrobium sp. CCC2.4]